MHRYVREAPGYMKQRVAKKAHVCRSEDLITTVIMLLHYLMMEKSTLMKALCQHLAAFHISVQLQRITEGEEHLEDPKLQPQRSEIEALQQTSRAYSCRPDLQPPKVSRRPC